MDIRTPEHCAMCGQRVLSRKDFIRHHFVHRIAEASGQSLAEADEGMAHLEEMGLLQMENDQMVLLKPKT